MTGHFALTHAVSFGRFASAIIVLAQDSKAICLSSAAVLRLPAQCFFVSRLQYWTRSTPLTSLSLRQRIHDFASADVPLAFKINADDLMPFIKMQIHSFSNISCLYFHHVAYASDIQPLFARYSNDFIFRYQHDSAFIDKARRSEGRFKGLSAA
jgi:hypothetical protein